MNPVYIGLSKKSLLAARLDKIRIIVRRMIEEGEIDRIIRDYFQRNHLQVPEYN